MMRLFSKFCFDINTFVLSIIQNQYQPSSCLNSCATASGTATPALPCAPLTQYSWRGTLRLISNSSFKVKKETLLCCNLSQIPGCSSIRDLIQGTCIATLLQSEVVSLEPKGGGSRQSKPPPMSVPTRVHSRSSRRSNGPPLSPSHGSLPPTPTFVSRANFNKSVLFTVTST